MMWVAMTMATISGLATMGVAQEQPTNLPPVTVYGEREAQKVMPDEEGAKIYQGKKTSVTELKEIPPVVNNNYRQAFTQTPGLLVSEQITPGQVNLGYRGIGDPHESEFLLTLQDGIPIVSDWFGYSTVYYTPTLESIDRLEFIRGGSALLYGPQPGPVLNYISSMPPTDSKFTARTQHTFGSWGLYSTYNEFGGTVDRLRYLGNFQHRGADGPRDSNSDYEVFSGGAKVVFAASDSSRWILDFNGYSSESGEAGRLTLAQYQDDRNQTTRPIDRIWVERYVPSLTFEHYFSTDTLLTVKGWVGYQDRLSRRQNNAGTFTNLDRQEFYFGGLDTRMRHTWEAWGNLHTLTGGFVVYAADSPRIRERNAGLSEATSGTPRFDLDRSTQYGALFVENKFQFDRFALIPAFRLEMMRMSVEEKFNTEVTRPLIDETFTKVVPLGGLGMTFDLNDQNQLYANVSQGYRPPKYDDLANPTSNSQLPSSDLTQSRTWNHEIGVRGTPAPWFWYDTSLFFVDYDGYIENRDLGGGNVERSNSGQAHFKGIEAAVEADLIGLYDAVAQTDHGKRRGSFSVFGNVSLLDAKFVEGRNDGNEPGYAPEYIVKTGAIYRPSDDVKVALTGTMVGDHFWQDSNAAGSVGTDKVASYMVWDLAAEAKLWSENVTALMGINNLFDEDYYSRIRSDGIDPAARRNFYVGMKIRF